MPRTRLRAAATLKAAAEVKQQLAEAFGPGDRLRRRRLGRGHRQGRGHLGHRPARFRHVRDRIGVAAPRTGAGDGKDRQASSTPRKAPSASTAIPTRGRFAAKTYDNWRLSTARAHSAYYMLVRGGVDERRITEVAGFADRQPKDPANPLAAANRRIEILMATGG